MIIDCVLRCCHCRILSIVCTLLLLTVVRPHPPPHGHTLTLSRSHYLHTLTTSHTPFTSSCQPQSSTIAVKSLCVCVCVCIGLTSCHTTGTTQPPLEIQGSLDIALDSVHTTHNISSLPIHAVVGVAKLLAPGSFQVCTHTHTHTG